ncbi:MAG: response regulator transcription factor [Bacteroidetes bacterium]|nr:response regulator transcription factor [Bacteroidota bacterium]
MKTVYCAIIEDEPLGAKTLRALLKKYQPQFEVERTGRNMAEAKDIFEDPDIDLIFSDVELLDGNVFEVLKTLGQPLNKHIIFTTAYEEFGAKAFNYAALHYLLKPINPDELDKAITRYKDVVQGKANSNDAIEEDFTIGKLLLPTQNGMLFVEYDEVVRVQSSNKYSIVFTTDKKQHIVSKPLSRFEEVLIKKGFIRIHDSHIINLNHVKSYNKGKGGEIGMSDGSMVPISVRRKDALATIFKDMI